MYVIFLIVYIFIWNTPVISTVDFALCGDPGIHSSWPDDSLGASPGKARQQVVHPRFIAFQTSKEAQGISPVYLSGGNAISQRAARCNAGRDFAPGGMRFPSSTNYRHDTKGPFGVKYLHRELGGRISLT